MRYWGKVTPVPETGMVILLPLLSWNPVQVAERKVRNIVWTF